MWYTVMERELSACGATKVSRKGMTPISLSAFNRKLDCWIYDIDMIQKCLFISLLDDPGVIYKPKPYPGG